MRKRTAADFMSTVIVSASENMLITQIIELMLEHKVSSLPVVDSEMTLHGIITEYDVMNLAFSGEAARTKVGEVMARNVVTFALTDDLETVANTCLQRRIHRGPVVQDGKVVGIISRRDILREILAIYRHH
jgi:CBS domain-containing protein